MVPEIRITVCNQKQVKPEGDYVLYWMIAHRRMQWNYSLERAVDWANKLGKPLIILEALRCNYQWASDRLHHFILEGMYDNHLAARNTNAYYYPYVEDQTGAAKGLVQALSAEACVLLTDDFPCFFIPRMIESAARQCDVLLEKVDSNGLLPLQAPGKVFHRAFDLRRYLQKNLCDYLLDKPEEAPLQRLPGPRVQLPEEVTSRWPMANLDDIPNLIARLPIDHDVAAVSTRGGSVQAVKTWRTFLGERLADYSEKRNEPEQLYTSALSPYLHFGHISVHQTFHELSTDAKWHPGLLSASTSGKRTGWWGMSKSAESFLDELVTWRELGYNMCHLEPAYDRYESLPNWAQQTLSDHLSDIRNYSYTLKQFERAVTHDALWNAAQTELVTQGRIHNYLRMLWGKKILEWSESPQFALQVMIELNNKYALDGRNPNSYSGIFWTLGRYDRAWGPERQVFGKVRYMSSENTARKVRVKNYIKKYSRSNDLELAF